MPFNLKITHPPFGLFLGTQQVADYFRAWCLKLGCSATLEKKGTLVGAWTIFGVGQPPKKKEAASVPLN